MDKVVKEKEKGKIDYNTLINEIVSETLCRHSEMTEKEYLESLGVKDTNGKSEDEILNTGIYNLMIEILRSAISIKQECDGLTSGLTFYIKEHDLEEREKEFNKNKEKE